MLKISPTDQALPLIVKLRRTVSKYRLNIVHATFYPFYSPLPLIATIGKSCKLIYSDQLSRISHPLRGFKSPLRFLRNRFCQRYIYAIIADSRFIRECQIRDYYTRPDKVSVIYNGVNLERFRRAGGAQRAAFLRKFGIPQESYMIVTLAQCIWAKGLNYFIDAAGAVAKEYPSSFFFIIGDGPERSD